MNFIFRLLSSVVMIYSLLCTIRIILTWIPQVAYSPFASFLSRICDPFLNIFRGFRFLQLGSIDFSPALALCVLTALSQVCSSLGNGGKITISGILVLCVNLIFSLVGTFIGFFILLLIIRLVILLINKGDYYSSSPILQNIDRSISPLVYKLAASFSGGKKMTYQRALIIALILLFLLRIILEVACSLISGLLFKLPF